MHVLARTAVVATLAMVALAVPAAAAAQPPAQASIQLPHRVHAGQDIDVSIRCAATDTRARLRIRGLGVAVATSVSLRDGRADFSHRLPRHVFPGRYSVTVTCAPSEVSSTTNVQVSW
ncbi:MAG TPA: hypothetical protein VE172_02820 [Stackebrandtia sp.]|jgi:hypothetical protein|uniref:hypothetical protein n=1 Tax=Stackebrandtia sp. TaxID=2023065 RepID=UPI002D59DAEC|nr:hypothetical protein [Stackebrandtia sp.]HZE37720.1 hypothetical protein [Stackebrandtia sp.]